MAEVARGLYEQFDTEKNVASLLKLEFVRKVMEALSGKPGGAAESEELRREMSEFRREIAQRIAEAYSPERAAKLLDSAKKLVDEAARALEELGYERIVDANFVTLTPLAIGLRNPYTEPLEISISWDPYMNLPFIPGSSLKGAVASLAWAGNSEWYKLLRGEEGEEERSASPVAFLDAYPVEVLGRSLLSVDIINPHYREVEGGISEPESSPTPLPFLVVSKGVAFRIVVCAVRHRLLSRKRRPNVEDLKSLIGQALSKGVGAKTSLGYGRLKQQESAP